MDIAICRLLLVQFTLLPPQSVVATVVRVNGMIARSSGARRSGSLTRHGQRRILADTLCRRLQHHRTPFRCVRTCARVRCTASTIGLPRASRVHPYTAAETPNTIVTVALRLRTALNGIVAASRRQSLRCRRRATRDRSNRSDVWVAHVGVHRCTSSCTYTPIPLPRRSGLPKNLPSVADGNVWFTDTTGYVGFISLDVVRVGTCKAFEYNRRVALGHYWRIRRQYLVHDQFSTNAKSERWCCNDPARTSAVNCHCSGAALALRRRRRKGRFVAADRQSTPQAKKIGTAAFTLKIPGSSTMTKLRRRYYQSQATQGVAIDWASSNPSAPDYSAPITATCPSPAPSAYPPGVTNCVGPTQSADGGTDYTFQLSIPAGTYPNFTVTTFDQAPASGETFTASANMLAQGQLAAPVVITGGTSNTIPNLTFYGIPASVSFVPGPAQSHVTTYGGNIAVIGNAPQTFFAQAVDADGFVIDSTDSGAPTVTVD